MDDTILGLGFGDASSNSAMLMTIHKKHWGTRFQAKEVKLVVDLPAFKVIVEQTERAAIV